MSDKDGKVFAKNVNFVNGVNQLGSRLSLQANRHNTLEVTAIGVKATSTSTERSLLIPWNNISGIELYYDGPHKAVVIEAPPKNVPMRTKQS